MTYPADNTPPSDTILMNQPPDDFQRALQDLGLTDPGLHPELDAFATVLAERAGTPYAMVNIIGNGQQQFFGLHTPQGGGEFPPVGRTMRIDHGYCPEVVKRGKALVLPDVYAKPEFAGNEVVDLLNIRTYAGAPLIYAETGVVLGTVCFVGPVERPLSTGQASLSLIKSTRDEVMKYLRRSR